MTLGVVTATDIALTVHVAAVIVAFGALFTYPVLAVAVRQCDQDALHVLYHAKHVVARRVITPALMLLIAAGLFLADKEHAFGKAWVIVPMVLVVLLMALHRLVLMRGYRRLSEQTVATDPRPQELRRLSRRIERAELAAAGLVLLAVFVMAAKPFA